MSGIARKMRRGAVRRTPAPLRESSWERAKPAVALMVVTAAVAYLAGVVSGVLLASRAVQ